MKLLADEGVEQYLVQALRTAGHNVDYVAELAPGMSDDEVLTMATRDSSLLLTND